MTVPTSFLPKSLQQVAAMLAAICALVFAGYKLAGVVSPPAQAKGLDEPAVRVVAKDESAGAVREHERRSERQLAEVLKRIEESLSTQNADIKALLQQGAAHGAKLESLEKRVK